MGKRKHAALLACVALTLLQLFALVSCQRASAAEPSADQADYDQTEAALEAVNAQASDASALPGSTPGGGVPVSRMVSECGNGYIIYPHVLSGDAASAVNEAIISGVGEYAAQQSCMVFTKYKVEYNKNGILSFRMLLYDLYGDDSAALQVIPLTFDMRTGEKCGIADLFEGADERWRGVLPEIVAAQAEKRGITLLNDLLPIGDAQQYYIGAGGVVLMYHIYEIATYDAGAPEFVIPVAQLAEFIGESSPLAGMLEDAQAKTDAEKTETETETQYAAEVS